MITPGIAGFNPSDTIACNTCDSIGSRNPAIAATRELLRAAGTLLVHLEVELVTALARCSGTEQIRPVLADQANLAARYQRRLPLYREAHVSIGVDALTPDEAVEAIVRAAGLGCPLDSV